MQCPNISSQEWKNAVEKFGGAEAALSEFVYNGFSFPSEITLSNRHAKLDKGGNLVFDRQKTLQLFESNPQLINDVLKKLQELYPAGNLRPSKLIKNRPDTLNYTNEQVKEALYNLPKLQVSSKDQNFYTEVDENGNEIGELIPRVSTQKGKVDQTAKMKRAANRGTIVDDMLREAVNEKNNTGKTLSLQAYQTIYDNHKLKDQTEPFTKDFIRQVADIIENEVLSIPGLTLVADIPALSGMLNDMKTNEVKRFAGTVDLIGYDEKGNWHLIDLKTSSVDRFQAYKGHDKFNYQEQDAIQLASYLDLLKQITGKDFKPSILPIYTTINEQSGKYNSATISKSRDGKILLDNQKIPTYAKKVSPIKATEIPPGENGMHYKNAFMSAVSWSLSDEVKPPYEYVDFYLEDLQGSPVVKELLSKYPNTKTLSKILNRHANGEQISENTEKKINEFWQAVRDFYGNVDVKNIVEQEVQDLSSVNSFSEENSEAKNIDDDYRSVMNYETNGYLNVEDTKLAQYKIKNISKDDAINIVKQKLFDKKGETTTTAFVQQVNTFINEYKRLKNTPNVSRAELPILNESYIDIVDRIINNAEIVVPEAAKDSMLAQQVTKVIEESKKDGYINELLSDVKSIIDKTGAELNHPVSANMLVNFMTMAEIQTQHMAMFGSSIIVNDNNYVDLNIYNDLIEQEIDNELRKRKQFLSGKPKWVQKVYEWLEKGGVLLTGPRQHALFLTGSLDSNLSKLHSKALNQAESNRVDILNKFEDIVTVADFEAHKEGSMFLTGQEDIKKVKGLDFAFKSKVHKDKVFNVKLTDSEMLSIYMIARQDTKELDEHISPKDALLEQGFAIDPENADSRGLLSKDYMMITEGHLETIKNYVEQNYSDFVSKIDSGLDMMYNHINKTHKMMNGFTLGKRSNYFPLRHVGTKSFKFNEKQRLISELSSTHMRPGGTKPFLIQDINQILQQHKQAGALYSAYTVPMYNGTKVLNNLLKKYQDQKEITKYLSAMDAHYKKIGNIGVSISRLDTQKQIDKFLNKLTSEFSAGVLGLNVGVMAKQGVSLTLAKTYIDSKYLNKAGLGVAGIVGINPKDVFKNLDMLGKQGKPMTWQFNENDETYVRLRELSPKLYYRLKGNSSRETNEAYLESAKNDISKIGPVKVSKKRMMEGIRIVDSATILTIFKAVEIEAQEKYKLKPGSPEFNRFVKNKTEMVVDLTQPTYDINNRSYLHSMDSPFVRMFTLFGSARSKIGMQYLESFYNYLHNPSAENKKKFMKMNVNAVVLTSILLATIDLAKQGLFGGLDDDDYETYNRNLIMNTMSGFFGLSDVTRLLVTRLDNAPWSANLEHPLQALVESSVDGVAAVANGNVDRAIQKLSFSILASKGMPIVPVNETRKVAKAIFEE